MIIHKPNNEILTNSSDKRSSFSIDVTAHSFRVLSDSLYQHKITTIIRELAANAYDAHVAAGKSDLPFKVCLPNEFNPFFSVEDFGIGLDDEDVRTVCTVYFRSTKQQSNDGIGGLGLGMKSPLAYTDTYSITTYKDGVERLYGVFINEEGIPDIDLVVEMPTDRCNGIKIGVPVLEEDFENFKNEAQFILSLYDVKPEVIGNQDFQFDFPDIANKLKESRVATEHGVTWSDLYRGHSIFFVMGPVAYPVSHNVFNSFLKNTHVSYAEKILLKNYSTKLFIKFNIGDFSISASRESISFDHHTKEFFYRELPNVIDDLMKEDIENIAICKHPVHALEYIQKKYNIGYLGYSMFEYKGKNLNTISHECILEKRSCVLYTGTLRATNGYRVQSSYDIRYSSFVGKNVIGIIVDTKTSRGLLKAVKSNIGSSADVVLTIHKNCSELHKRRIETVIGKSITWKKLSDLVTKPNRSKSSTPTIKRSNTEVSCRGVEFTGKTFNIRSWSKLDLSDKSKNIYYTTYSKLSNEIIEADLSNSTRYYSITFPIINKILIDLDKSNTIIIVKNKTNGKKIESTGIKEYTEFVKEFVMKNLDTIALLSSNFGASRISNEYWANYGKTPIIFNREIYNVIDHEFKDYLKDLNLTLTNLCTSYEYRCHLRRLHTVCEEVVTVKSDEIDSKYEEMTLFIENKYPLLNHISPNTPMNLIEEYVNFIDNHPQTVV